MVNIYKLPERLDSLKAQEIDNEVEQLVNNSIFVILDFSDCLYLASMGIRIIIKSKKTLSAKGGDLILVKVNPSIKSILEMAGISSLIKIMESAEQAISSLQQDKEVITTELVNWDNLTLAGYNELQFAVGVGSPAEGIGAEDHEKVSCFVTETCAGFINKEAPGQNDFRITEHPEKTGIYLMRGCSFGTTPRGYYKPQQVDITIKELLAALQKDKADNYTDALPESLYVIYQQEKPLISIIFQRDGEPTSTHGCIYTLEEWKKCESGTPFNKIIKENLTLNSILGICNIDENMVLQMPEVALFHPNKSVNFKDTRLVIECDGNLELYKEFLARRIYTDSAKIEVKKLHGGFSAQTLQVTSYDSHGRRLRPTVMKVANKAMIDRESSRCRYNALPYIMNNSAQIIGTEFFDNMGALRYNFVGIGGDGSELKWLTDYYLKEDLTTLIPIFDKIFLKILYPWYGQAVKNAIKPFAEHDPSSVFFPHIFQTAKQELNIDSGQQYVYIEELGRDMLNPYWFLQHIYPKMRDYTIDYYSAICHGDLNMQNILLDDKLNVFLIDFSETQMRCAVSDFARLEVIIMVDNAPCKSEKEYEDYIRFAIDFYTKSNSLSDTEPFNTKYTGSNAEFINKNVGLTAKMRSYAINCAHNESTILPYLFPFLEWCLPVVCYSSQPQYTKRASMIISGIIAEKISSYCTPASL